MATSEIVVDASVVAKWHLPDEDHLEQATLLLSRFVHGDVALYAPDHIRYEVPSAITLATRGSSPRLTIDDGRSAIEDFLNLGIETIASNTLIMRAFGFVQEHGVSFYGALYLAAAIEVDAPLITADRKLYQRVRHLPWTTWLGSYR